MILIFYNLLWRQQPKTFELKVNLSGTEFVLLDNLDSADTNAVVLKVSCVLMPFIQKKDSHN